MVKKVKKKSSSKDGNIYDLFRTAEQLLEEQTAIQNFISVGPVLDDALGGGIPSGSLVSIRTKEKAGKTALCMNVVRNALLQGRKVFFFDIENRLTGAKYFSMENFNVKDDNFKYISSTKGNILKAEEILSLQIQLMSLEENEGALYIVDSLSKLVSAEVIDSKEVSGQRRSDIAKIQTDWLAKAGNMIRTSNSIVIVIQHLMQSQEMFAGPKAKGADAVNYEADICLLSYGKPRDLNGNTKFAEKDLSGLSMNLTIPYNKMKAPIVTADGITTYIKFGEGVYFSKEMISLLPEYFIEDKETKELIPMLDVSGSWFKFNCGEIQDRVQGSNKATEIIENNKEYFKKLHFDNMKKLYNANYDLKKK